VTSISRCASGTQPKTDANASVRAGGRTRFSARPRRSRRAGSPSARATSSPESSALRRRGSRAAVHR
jgi:hypothetical protein